MTLVAQHQFVAVLRAAGWRASLLGTWTEAPPLHAVAPDGTSLALWPPPDSDDRNEKGAWSSVWLDPDGPALTHPDVRAALEVASLGDDVLTGPLGPQGRYRRRGLQLWLARAGLEDCTVEEPWLVVPGGHLIHLASGAVRDPAGRVRPRDLALAPLGLTDDPGLGRILAEALRLRRAVPGCP